MRDATKPELVRRRFKARVLTLIVAAASLAAPVRAQTPAAKMAADLVEPASNRLFFAPTGRTLPAGTWQIGTYQILAPYANYAPTEWFMISVGTPLLPGSGFGQVWYFAPKAQVYDGDRLDVAVGGLGLAFLSVGALTAPFGFESDAMLAWGVATMGDEERSLTAGVAHPTWGSQRDGEILILGMELRLRSGDGEDGDQALKLIAEGYHRSGQWTDRSLAAAGFRFHDSGMSFELVGVVSDGELRPFPFISMSFDL